MPACKHTYQQHLSGFAAFCKGNPDRWYPFAFIGCMGVIALVLFGFFMLMWSLFA